MSLPVDGPLVAFAGGLQLVPPGVGSGAVRIAGLAVVAGGVAAVVAAVYRWYAREQIAGSAAVLAGLATVAVYLNTTAALSQVIGGGTGLLDPDDALVNTVTFLLAAAATLVGRGVGDRFARGLGAVAGRRELDADLSRLVRTVGRVIAVELPASPEDVEDIVGYDPVDDEVKAALAGKTLHFPRGLTVAELRARLAERLRDDYGVGHVDVDLAEDGTVEFLALGSRAAGIGATLPPGLAATAVRADPAYAASAGDVVQVWTTGAEPSRVATGELRGTAGDVVTLALEETDAEGLDPEADYRLVTLPSEPRADREFAALLRGAAETMGTVTVREGSPLVGTPVDDLEVTVVAVRPAEGEVEAIPRRGRGLDAGDELYVVARPAAIRRVERMAEPS